MYDVIKAMGLNDNNWEDFTADVGEISLFDLSEAYEEIRVTFQHDVIDEKKEYRGENPLSDLEGVRKEDTFLTWAIRNGNKQIFGWDEITDWSLGRRSVVVKDLHYYGIIAQAGNNFTHPLNIRDRLELYPDIQLYKEGMDWSKIANTNLLSVNGLLSPILNYGDYAIADNGRTTVTADKVCDLELVSFENIGEFDIIRVGDRVDPLCVNEHRRDITLDVPELFDSNFLFVLNGRLVLNDSMFKWLDKTKLRIKFANYDLKNIVADDYKRLSFESQAPWWGGNVYNHEGMQRFFGAKQTFFIKFKEGVKLYTEVVPLQPSGFDGVYLDYDISADLLVRSDGRGVSKWIRHNGNPEVPHVISTTHGVTPRFWEDTGVDTDNTLLTGKRAPDVSYRSKNLYKLKIYTI